MNSTTVGRTTDSISEQLRKARRITDVERQFFPKTTSMPDPPVSQWAPIERPTAIIRRERRHPDDRQSDTPPTTD